MPTIVVFSHLRWDFVFQRPQHLMTRFARTFAQHDRAGSNNSRAPPHSA